MTRADQIQEAARELAAGATQKATATKLGVHRTTVRKWCSDPDFLEAFERETLRLQREIHAGVLRRAEKALQTFDRLMQPNVDERTQLGAAKAVMVAVGTTRPEDLGQARTVNNSQTVIVLGTREGDAAVKEAKARVMEARATAVLPRGARESDDE